jgi:phage shock protein A
MTQLETLKKDSKELKFYAEKLMKEGNTELARKIQMKSAYIDQHIAGIKKS